MLLGSFEIYKEVMKGFLRAGARFEASVAQLDIPA